MQAVSLGHAGILIRTRGITIVCDPWFVPAFLGSWFVFPRNDVLSDDIMNDVCNPDFLYVSHLHGDHFDAEFLLERMNKETTIILPNFPTRELEREFSRLGFRNFLRTTNGDEIEIAPHVKVAVHVETSITDGPGGDSAIVVSDGESRLVNQNDCRTNDLDALRAHGPVDQHWLQYSGAIWYPMVYEIPDDEKKKLCTEKVASQFQRAMRYVEAIDARTVVPSAGPPCFLDEELFGLNMVTGDEASIFPDATAFEKLLVDARRDVSIVIPGSEVTSTRDHVLVQHPNGDAAMRAIFADKTAYLRAYQADWASWLSERKAEWSTQRTDLVAELQAWWHPLLALAPNVRSGINANCLLDLGELKILINFPDGRVEKFDGQSYAFRFTVERSLIEQVVAKKSVDWSNSLFLSCRFRAWREGSYNEYLYNFFKSLSVERMTRTEAEASQKLNGVGFDEADITLGDFVVQRRCPHRNADLSVFGTIEGDQLVCTLHGWRFDTGTGQCLTADDKQIRVRRRTT